MPALLGLRESPGSARESFAPLVELLARALLSPSRYFTYCLACSAPLHSAPDLSSCSLLPPLAVILAPVLRPPALAFRSLAMWR